MVKATGTNSKKKATLTKPVAPEQQAATIDENLFDEVKKASLAEQQSEDLAEESESAIDYVAENSKLDLEIRKEKKERRKKWDTTLLYLVVSGFFFSYLFILLIGAGGLHFDNSTFAVPAVVAAGIIQTYGLAKIAAEYFFSEDGTAKKSKKR